ncbi:MAG TPA: hypothetical protein VK586_10690, partial [Streptosporangiaceae bacterium]|nr:hypothetical protein [Streptosporangiaceae bacterium]
RLARLLELVHGHQDALFRVSQPPGARYHRGVLHAPPLPEPRRGYQAQVEEVLRTEDDDRSALSLEPVARRLRVAAPTGDHVEFRLWGGDLDLGAIQARVRLSLALADAGVLLAGPPLPPGQSLGQHYRSQSAADGVAGLDGLLGLFGPGARLAREQVRRLWQLTAWQPPLVPRISGWGDLLWAGRVMAGPVWQGYSQAAAGYPGPVIMLVPPRAGELTRRVLAGGSTSSGFDPRAARVSRLQCELVRDLLEGLGSRAGVLPVVIALRPEGTDELAGLGAWLVRPARARAGGYGVNILDGPGRPAGWLSAHGWELVSPGGGSRSLGDDLLEGAAVRRALGIALAAPNPLAGLVRIAAGWYVAGPGGPPDAPEEAATLPVIDRVVVALVSMHPVTRRVQASWGDLDAAALNSLLGIVGVPAEHGVVVAASGARSPLPDLLARELSGIRGTRALVAVRRAGSGGAGEPVVAGGAPEGLAGWELRRPGGGPVMADYFRRQRILDLAAGVLGGAGQPGAADLLSLARQVGLDHRDSRPARLLSGAAGAADLGRLSWLLELGREVFGEGDDSAGVDQLRNLRRLADLVRAVPGGIRQQDVTRGHLEALFRELHGLPAAAPVSPAGLRELVAMTGQAKADARAHQPVTRQALAAVIQSARGASGGQEDGGSGAARAVTPESGPPSAGQAAGSADTARPAIRSARTPQIDSPAGPARPSAPEIPEGPPGRAGRDTYAALQRRGGQRHRAGSSWQDASQAGPSRLSRVLSGEPGHGLPGGDRGQLIQWPGIQRSAPAGGTGSSQVGDGLAWAADLPLGPGHGYGGSLASATFADGPAASSAEPRNVGGRVRPIAGADAGRRAAALLGDGH